MALAHVEGKHSSTLNNTHPTLPPHDNHARCSHHFQDGRGSGDSGRVGDCHLNGFDDVAVETRRGVGASPT